TQMKASRQEYAAAIDAPKATPSACPIGGPRLNRLNAVPRMPRGKSTGMIAYAGGTPPASPTPTVIRGSASCGYEEAMPQAAVAALHNAQENASTRTRLVRSASQPTGIARMQ